MRTIFFLVTSLAALTSAAPEAHGFAGASVEKAEVVPPPPPPPNNKKHPGFIALGTEYPEMFYATLYQVPWEIQEDYYNGHPQYVATSDLGFFLRREIVPMFNDFEQPEDDTPVWGIWTGNTTIAYTMAVGTAEEFPPDSALWMIRELKSDEMVPVSVTVVKLTCDDDHFNGDEEGVDCGGKYCSRQCDDCMLPKAEMSENHVTAGECPANYTMTHAMTCQVGCSPSYSPVGGTALCVDGEVALEVNCIDAPKFLDVEGSELVSGNYALVGTEDNQPVYMSLSVPPQWGAELMMPGGVNSTVWNIVLISEVVGGAAVVAYRESPIRPYMAAATAWHVFDVDQQPPDFFEMALDITEATCKDGKQNGDEQDVDCGGSSADCRECHSCQRQLPPSAVEAGNCPEDLKLLHGDWCAPKCSEDTSLWGSVWGCTDGVQSGHLECVEVPLAVEVSDFRGSNQYLNGEYVLLFNRPLYSDEAPPVYGQFLEGVNQMLALVYRLDLEAWAIQPSLTGEGTPLAWAEDVEGMRARTPLEIESGNWETAAPSNVILQ